MPTILDEPDFIQGILQLGKEKRLRAFLDDAPLHTKAAIEPLARKAITSAAGANNVVSGHFNRFAHCKVMIQRRNGKPVKVLTGSGELFYSRTLCSGQQCDRDQRS